VKPVRIPTAAAASGSVHERLGLVDGQCLGRSPLAADWRADQLGHVADDYVVGLSVADRSH